MFCPIQLPEKGFANSRFGARRALPYLLAANPINTYKPIKLSTAEAIAAALYIAGFKDNAEDIMSVFKWGPSFITLNQELLDAYAACESSIEVVRIQTEYMNSQSR
ncbi:MAG: DUF367 domain-containing protein [Candidatus Thorarchaeota archaeon]